MKQQEIYLGIVAGREIRSAVKPGDAMTAPLRVVLHESHASTEERPEYVVHGQNMQDGGLFNGDYFRGNVDGMEGRDGGRAAWWEAVQKYVERCHNLQVEPFPDLSIQNIPAGVPKPINYPTRLAAAACNYKKAGSHTIEADISDAAPGL